MKTFFELPEYQLFHVFREGDSEPCGPFSSNQLLTLLNENVVSRQDLVFYKGLARWHRLHDVFDIHERVANFESEGHDPEILNLAFAELSKLSSEGEEFYDLVIQEKGMLGNRWRDVAALSDRGVWVGAVDRRGEFRGSRLESDEVRQATAVYPGRWDLGKLRFDLVCGGRLEIKRVPRRQLRRFVAMWRQLAAERWESRRRKPLPLPMAAHVAVSGT